MSPSRGTHDGALALDFSRWREDETLLPLLHAVFGEDAVIEHWRGGAKQLSGPCRDGSIHDGYAATVAGVGHWLCRKCGQELCETSGGCITPEEGEPWRP